MEKQCAGFYVVFCGLCLALCFPVALASGRLQVTLVLYEFLYYGRQPTRTSDFNKPQMTVTMSDESSTDVSDVTTEPPGLGGGVQSGKSSDEEAIGTNREPPFPWQQETVCDTTSPPSPRYRFLLCFDRDEPMSNPSPCQLRRLETSALPLGTPSLGRDIVMFPVVLASRPTQLNPVTLDFDRWPGSVRLSVFVTCCGVLANFSGQCEETLTHVISGIPAPSTWPSQPRNIYLEGQGRLMLRIALQCDESFYGPACDRLCRIESPQAAHAFCNVTTGHRQCMPGWEGSECQTDTDECRFHYCRNGAECVNSPPGSFSCKCPFGTGGPLCEARVSVCHQRPCLNGATCLDSVVGFLCFCRPGFTGYRCEVVMVTETGNGSSALHYLFEQRPVSLLGQDNTQPETVGDNSGMPSHEQLASTWHTWYIALIVFAVLVITPIVVLGCLIIKGRKQYKISGRRSFCSFRFTARVLKSTVRRQRNAKDKDKDRETDADCHPYIVHLHRTDNSGSETNNNPGGNDDDDSYQHIVQLHRQSTTNSNHSSSNNANNPADDDDKYPHIVHLHRQVAGDQPHPPPVNLFESRPVLGAFSRTRENGRPAHDPRTLPLSPPLLPLLPVAAGGVQETFLQKCQLDVEGGFQGSTRDNRDSGSPCCTESVVGEQTKGEIFQKRAVPSGASCFDERLELVYAIGGTMTFEELSFARSKHRKPGSAELASVPSSSLSSSPTSSAATVAFIQEVEALQESQGTSRNVRRVDSAGYEVPQIRRPFAEGESSSGWDTDIEDHYHRITHPNDLIYEDAGSETASLLELGVCTAVPPPRDVR